MIALLVRIAVVAALLIAAAAWLWLGAWRRGRSRREALAARDVFVRDRRRLAEEFRAAAAAAGKPRGLAWAACELAETSPLLAYDAPSRELVALAGVTISFEALPGGDMEEVEAVGDLRDATAVFLWRGGAWQTDGRAVFNHSPEATLARFGDTLTAIDAR